jgi:hypothetical protein
LSKWEQRPIQHWCLRKRRELVRDLEVRNEHCMKTAFGKVFSQVKSLEKVEIER